MTHHICDCQRARLGQLQAEREALASAFCDQHRQELLAGARYAEGVCLRCRDKALAVLVEQVAEAARLAVRGEWGRFSAIAAALKALMALDEREGQGERAERD